MVPFPGAMGTDKARFVRSMFDAIARRYDLMNRLMTGWQDERWRRMAADAIFPESTRRAMDVGAGTGDLSFAIARAATSAHVLAVDFSPQMLQRTAEKARQRGLARRVQAVLGDAMRLPAASESVDAVVTGFTMRNVSDIHVAIAEFHRVLRPGGRLAILELTPVRHPLFGPLFRLYFHRMVPVLGGMVSGKGYAYRYLPESVLRFPNAESLAQSLAAAGFQSVTFQRLAMGTLALHVAHKAQAAVEVPPPNLPPSGGGAVSPPLADLPPDSLGPLAGDAESGTLADVPPNFLPQRGRARVGEPLSPSPHHPASPTPHRAALPLATREVRHEAEWESVLRRLPAAHFMQSWAWGAFRAEMGYGVRRIAFERDGVPVGAASVVRRAAPLIGLGFDYCPKGPVADYADRPTFSEVLSSLASDTTGRRSVLVKIDPDVEARDVRAVATLRGAGYVPADSQVQFRSTVITPIDRPDEALLAQFKPTWRRYVRRAERDGVVVRTGGEVDLERFYALYKETALRDGFIIRPEWYYRNGWRHLHAAGLATLLLADVAGQTEGAVVPVCFGHRSWYLWGATSTKAQKTHAMYALQWQAMRWARDRRCLTYDMWGAPDDPQDKSDPTHGLYYFKQGFGGQHVTWAGAYDHPNSRLGYALWNLAVPKTLAALRSISGERPANQPGAAA